jgi:phospholipid transport system transporter-binding protein
LSASLQRVDDTRWRLTGELDFNTVTDLHPRIEQAIGSTGVRMELDLGGITGANSAALALLLQCRESADRQGIELSITRPPDALVELARLSNLKPLLGFG